jgi:hypothetical protein
MALAVIWMSVAAGIALGLWQRVAGHATGPIRTFAVVAAGLVVAVSLLPHAIESKGLGGLAAALGSIALVPAPERLFRVAFRQVTAEGLRLELGYAGLLLHRVGDGAVMGVGGHGSELTWAVGAHEIPIVALVTLAYARRGLQPALVRAAVLGMASSCGYWLVHSAPASVEDLHGWVDAIAAGILVHILVYEALPDPLHTARERASDVLGAALGLLVMALPHTDEHADAPSVAHSLLQTALAAAPALLLGLLGSAAVLWQARRRGHAGGQRSRVAIARPYPALEAFTQLVRGVGWLGTLGYILGASALSLAATLTVRALVARRAPATAAAEIANSPPSNFGAALEALVLRVGGWLAVGLLGASYVESFVPISDVLGAPGALLRATFMLAVAAPASICSGFAVPIAAALIGKGLAPALALVGLALGAVVANAASVLARASVGQVQSLLGLAPLVLAGLAFAVWLLPASEPFVASTRPSQPAGIVEWAALVLLAVVVCKSIWRVGIRGWLGASLQALSPVARPPHAHAH